MTLGLMTFAGLLEALLRSDLPTALSGAAGALLAGLLAKLSAKSRNLALAQL
jgi:hypothetical protein